MPPLLLRLISSITIVATGAAHAGIYSPELRSSIDPSKYPFVVAIDQEVTKPALAGCAGVFISEELILTAKHCPVGRFRVFTTQLRVTRTAGTSGGPRLPTDWDGHTRLVETSSSQDFKILRALWYPGRKPENVPVAKLGSEPLSVGEPISIVGFPMDRDGELTESLGNLVALNYVSSQTKFRGEVFTLHNASQTKQNSGGPLISLATGAVIGVVSASTSGRNIDPHSQNLELHSKAVPMAVILRDSDVIKNLELHSGPSARPYEGSTELNAATGPLKLKLSAYLSQDGRSARLELLDIRIKLNLQDMDCSSCAGRFTSPKFGGVFVLEEQNRERILRVVEWPLGNLQELLMVTPPELLDLTTLSGS